MKMNIALVVIGFGLVWIGGTLAYMERRMGGECISKIKEPIVIEKTTIVTRNPGVSIAVEPEVVRSRYTLDGAIGTWERWIPIIGKDGKPDMKLTQRGF